MRRVFPQSGFVRAKRCARSMSYSLATATSCSARVVGITVSSTRSQRTGFRALQSVQRHSITMVGALVGTGRSTSRLTGCGLQRSVTPRHRHRMRPSRLRDTCTFQAGFPTLARATHGFQAGQRMSLVALGLARIIHSSHTRQSWSSAFSTARLRAAEVSRQPHG